MNTKFLFSQLAHELQTNIFVLDLEKNYVYEESHPFTEGLRFFDPIQMKKVINFLSDLNFGDPPLISSFDSDIVYACCAGRERYYLIGPVTLALPLTIKHTMPLPVEVPAINLEHTICPLSTFIKDILWIQNLCCEHIFSENSILTHNLIVSGEVKALSDSSNLEFHNRENQKRHNSYYQELRLLSSIEQGDLKLLEESNLDQPIAEELGLLSKDQTRNFKNISISLITLISRAAIRGGLHPETAFSMCDSYIMQIEEMKNLAELQPLVESAKTTFTLLVHDLNTKKFLKEKESHPLVEKAKDTIYAKLHGKVSLKEIALELNVNPNYLSDLFREHEGISFSTYVRTAKIELVKNLLIYSPYSYSEIASYLGFASQSHLGKQFKEATGMTLREFRTKYASILF